MTYADSYVKPDVEPAAVTVTTPDGQMPAMLFTPTQAPSQLPAILLLMEAFGVTAHLQAIATRIAREGYVVLTPNLYYRELPHTSFGYEEVEQAMATMYRLDFGEPIETDIRAALAFLQSRPNINPDRVGVMGFCLGGGLSFMTACKLSAEIAAAAPFYGMVLDEWIEAMPEITVPIYLFFGGMDPFIPRDRIHQIEARLQDLHKQYTLKIYSDATHGFFCDERSSYHPVAAMDAWDELMQFFQQHLQGD